MDAPVLPPPMYAPPMLAPPWKPRGLRRHPEISSSHVLVEMLDSVLKELAIAEKELAAKEATRDALWIDPALSNSPKRHPLLDQSDEYEDARMAVYDAEQRMAWCERKVDITMEMALNPPTQFSEPGNVLISASCTGNVNVVFALLKRRINVNDLGHGMTALAYAAQGPFPDAEIGTDKYVAIVKALLQAGADIYALDNKGKTALSRAIDFGQKEIEAVLRAHGAV